MMPEWIKQVNESSAPFTIAVEIPESDKYLIEYVDNDVDKTLWATYVKDDGIAYLNYEFTKYPVEN